MNSNYAHLPPHIIVDILKLLPIADLKNAVMVCKPWYNISCCMAIGRRLKIRFNGDVNNSYNAIIRPFHRLELTQVNLRQWDYKDFLQKFAFSIRELHITRCAISFNNLRKCLQYLSNLETLLIEMRGDIKLKMTGKSCSNLNNSLDNIKVLSIVCGADQCAGLNFLLSKCTKLEELTYYAHSLNSYDNTKIYVNMCNAMAKWPSVNLSSLKIEGDAVTNLTLFFKSFNEINQVTVKKMILHGTPDRFDRYEFENFCKKLPNLEELEMWSMNDLYLVNICTHMLKLRVLTVAEFKGQHLGVIGELHNLEILDVSVFNGDQEGLYHLATSNMPKLTVLKLNRVKISKEILKLMCENFQNLLKLKLYLDTHDCTPIFKYLQKLNVLEIYFCHTCTESYTEISTEYTCLNLKQLRYLNTTKYVPGMTADLLQKMETLSTYGCIPRGFRRSAWPIYEDTEYVW